MNWFWIIFYLTFILLPIYVNAKFDATKRLHSLKFNNEKIKFSWLVDWSNQQILFHIQNPFIGTNNKDYTKVSPLINNNWFWFGFSKRGEFPTSDLCIFQIINDETGKKLNTVDAYSSDDGRFIYMDKQQDCNVFHFDEQSIAFKRKFDTCDPKDFPIHDGTMYLLWALGDEEFKFNYDGYIRTPEINYKNKGMEMAQLLRADHIDIPEKNIKNVEIVVENVEIPAIETTYWCKVQKLNENFNKKHHIVQFEPIIKNSAYVHHMEVFHCNTDPDVVIPLYNGDCKFLPTEAKVCSKVISLWAMGASTFTYPKETGLPIGGKDYNPYIRLEVHYNNPLIDSGVIDSSGMRINYISELRQFDAAVMELGLQYSDKMAIPPGLNGFPLSGYCIAECTHIALPETGIKVFGSQLHTHLRGVRVLTRHFRGNRELKEINRDDFYSHHYQEIRTLKHTPQVYPGDALVTTCYYNTTGYTNTTLGGFSISDEMCVNYIHYYPATILEVCKSTISEETLADYFKYMKKKEHQKTVEPGGAVSENYRSIEWTKSRVDELYTMYTTEPLSMQCNRSDGARFDGYNWEGAPITPVRIQVPIHWKFCPKENPFLFNTKDNNAEDYDEEKRPLLYGDCDFLGECIY